MSAGEFGPHVVAFQALCALDAYEDSISAVVDNWFDLEHYAAASRELDRIRNYMLYVPGLAAPWVTVLISHTELVHTLWRCQREHAPVDAREREILADHLQAVHYLKARCQRLIQPVRIQ